MSTRPTLLRSVASFTFTFTTSLQRHALITAAGDTCGETTFMLGLQQQLWSHAKIKWKAVLILGRIGIGMV